MRILHLVHQYLPDRVGGTELYTRWAVDGLARRGHEMTVFYRRGRKGTGCERRVENQVQVFAAWAGQQSAHRRFMATYRDDAMARAFEQVLDAVRPDLVHIEHLMGLPAALVHAIQRRGLPYVITLWDFWWVCANAQLLTNDTQRICDGPQGYLNCARCALARSGHSRLWPAVLPLAPPLAYRNQLLASIMRGAAALIAPTEFVQRWYATHGTPQARLRLISPALQDDSGPSEGQRAPGRPIRFVYIGGLSWQKGVHVLVDAFRGVQGAAELWIAGDESFDPAYVARLRQNATSGVRFLGRLARPEVWATLAQADVVVVPTLWYETFSFLISEAFMAGRPVIASRLGPLADRVRDGEDGLLVPAGEAEAWRTALQRLVDDPAHLSRLKAGVQKPLTFEDHLTQLEALYTEVTAVR